ncbi:DUF211 domain-containing protein [Promethearchaeum syntrophicum]|uniref:DUF211 domain-containing protein n=1 Tax=Promethearchaeum syntrophicum TaxID=2594042 RepID=A0A5B9D6F1_9ARCH|nr:DUF211 domain-containing protein [Candidatus Prometheoarchaeum syntrophicum]QEE14367.1 hypothetical protein DSAG12_00180 [Candidatus Prometheoarchaeum syntrophicum]
MSDDKLMIRRLVLDILKPFDPELHIVATEVINRCKISKEISVNLTVNEVDKLTQTIKFIIEGINLDFDEIQEILNSMNCIIHSVDQVAAGKKIVENIDTPQD